MSKIELAPDASGTGTFTVASPNSNSSYTLTLPIETGTVATEAYVAAANKVVQAVSGFSTTQQSISTAGTWTAVSGLTVSITPTSASNKILVLATGSFHQNNNGHSSATVWRNGAAFINGAAATYGNGALGGPYDPNGDCIQTRTYNYLDSPATTSSITYQFAVYTSPGGGNVFFNRSSSGNDSASSSIVLVEIAP